MISGLASGGRFEQAICVPVEVDADGSAASSSSSISISISISSSSSPLGLARFAAGAPPSPSPSSKVRFPASRSFSSCSYSPCALDTASRAAAILAASRDLEGSVRARVAWEGVLAYVMR